MNARVAPVVLSLAALLATPLAAQKVTKEDVPGVVNFARLETTVACGGATKVEAVPAIKKMGFAAIINVREASEPGADVDAEAAAAKAVGLNFVHVPFNVAAPAPDLVDKFLAAISKPENNPAFIHCAGGGRAAGLWMIKRVQLDGWDEQRAVEEATALGMTERLKTFALNYVHSNKR
jgi:uncharacterized protein (TIGR01244 family)